MLSANFVLATALIYVLVLFLLAFASDRQSRRGGNRLIRSPLVYTLSLSVYCTSWTFYGAVGSAARNGLEFAAIYLGPTLVFVGWWFFLRKLVRIGHTYRITSIADLISSRFGKSTGLAILVTCIAVISTTPYIALQLKAVTTSFQVVSGISVLSLTDSTIGGTNTALWVAISMALFTILFGTRNLDANEHHPGVVAAIAFEALVKLFAILAVGFFVVFSMAGGINQVFEYPAATALLYSEQSFSWRWVNLLLLSAIAIICLPRQFQTTVVENSNENHLKTASWAFPLYLFLMSLFVIPIAIAGLSLLPEDANPDMFLLTLPISAGQNSLALLAFIGGFSSATSMVIVASIALSIMISNHIIVPLALKIPLLRLNSRGDIKYLLRTSRRISIGVILFLGYVYYRTSAQSDALASIGLIAFVGVSQFCPAIIAGMFWRNATAKGVTVGMSAGFLLWAYTLFLPSLTGSPDGIIAHFVEQGLWSIEALKPQALFGLTNIDPLVHAVFWSLGTNIFCLIVVSVWSNQSPLEQLQSALFVDVFRNQPGTESRVLQRRATSRDLYWLTQRILGSAQARDLFQQLSDNYTDHHSLDTPDPRFIAHIERHLAGSIGASTARTLVSQIATGETISLEEIINLVDETQQVVEYSHRLEKQSETLKSTARKLTQANEQLQQIDSQKDEFLSQVSHELRTPMTSIRSMAEILLDSNNIADKQRAHFSRIIYEESIRLTRLLDEILEISRLEHGEMDIKHEHLNPEKCISRAIETCLGIAHRGGVSLNCDVPTTTSTMIGDPDRFHQVMINLLTNAINYNTAQNPRVEVSCRISKSYYEVYIQDNGPGIEDRESVFEKFSRGPNESSLYRGSGLGLSISRQLMHKMRGSLELVDDSNCGACFRLKMPLGV